MSAVPSEYDEVESVSPDVPDAQPVVVRRSVLLAAPIGAAAAAVSIAYLWRAVHGGTPFDWVMWALLAAVSATYLLGLLDARTPLLVADELGVRIRLANQWRGLPWEGVEQIVVEPRSGRFRDGRLVIVPFNLRRVLDGLDSRGRRVARLNTKLHGAALAVPLGLVTRVSAAGERQLADRVAALSQGQSGIVTLIEPVTITPSLPEGPMPAGHEPRHKLPFLQVPQQRSSVRPDVHSGGRHRFAATIGHLVSRLARSADVDLPALQPRGPLPPAVPLRDPRPALRADITRDLTVGNAALAPAEHGLETVRRLPEDRQLRRPGSVDLIFEPLPLSGDQTNVWPIATLGEPVAPLVIDDFATHPASDPVIGPELLAARHRVGLTVDELAERTRIRPHVIESIEVDDFVPCGGDVYARGHLRTLARVLGQDPAPLLTAYDNRYAVAPVSARRVFEAELATGMTGSMRSTAGGPNWTLLMGVVLSLVLVWGAVRLFAGEPDVMVETLPPALGGQGPMPTNPAPIPAVPVKLLKLVAINSSTSVTVRDKDGNVLFGPQRLVLGETVTWRVPRLATVAADNGEAVFVRWASKDLGLLGQTDQRAELVLP